MSTPIRSRGDGHPLLAPEALALVVAAVLAWRGPTAWPEGALLADVALAASLAMAMRSGRLVAPAGALLGAATLLGTVSAAAALDVDAALHALAHWARIGMAFWLGTTLAAGPAGRHRVAAGLAIAGALASLHGLLQVLWLHPRLAAELGDGVPGVLAQLTDARANSVFLLPAHLGSFAAMGFGSALGLAVGASGRRRALALGLGGLGLMGVAISGSFTGIVLALVAGGAVVLVVLPARARSVAVAALVGVSLAAGTWSLARRSEEVARESPWGARARNWATACVAVREAPLLGHGPGSFGVVHARLRGPESNDVQHAHQAFLEAASDCGLGALALLAAFVASLAARLARGLRTVGLRDAGDGELGVAAGLAAAAAAAVLHGLLDFGWSSPEWALPAAAVLGAAWALAGARAVAPTRVALCAAVLAWAGLVARDGAGAVARWQGERALASAGAGRHDEARDRLARARAAEPLADRWAAGGASAALALARTSRDEAGRAALLREAEGLARAAVARSPRKAARHGLLSRVLAEQGDVAGAAVAATTAHELAPFAPEWRAWCDELSARLAEAGAP